MVPSMNPSDPAPFYQLDSEPFEGLCRDLFSREHGIASCDIYGVRGQSQLGVDLKAQRDDEYACEVAQCKCCEDFGPALIRDASEEFLKHLDVWRERNVRRYVLIVASPLDRKGQQDEIDRQVELFSSLGIRYEAWSARTLTEKLSAHPDLVWRYTRSKEWVEIICGDASEGKAAAPEREPDSARTGWAKAAMERELEALAFFKKLFGFEAKRSLREAVIRFEQASNRIGRRSIKYAQEFLSEEDGRLKVTVSRLRHITHSFFGLATLLFFLFALILHPVVVIEVFGERPNLLVAFCSMAALGFCLMTFAIGFNPYVQALRIRRELDRLEGRY